MQSVRAFVAAALLLAVAGLHSASFLPVAALGCPMAGCDSHHSFDTQLPIPAHGTQWTRLYQNASFASFATTDPQATETGCVFTVHGTATCLGPPTNPATGAPQPSVVSVVAATGQPVWTSDDVSSATLPLVLLNGVTVGYDARRLDMWTAGGHVTQGTALFPDDAGSRVWSVGSSAENGFVALAFEHGSVSAFLGDGVPIASRWLNDTFMGMKGVWAPFGAPVASFARVYLPTRWYATDDGSGGGGYYTNAIRIWAMDVHASVVNRTALVWSVDLTDVPSLPVTGADYERAQTLPFPDPQPISLAFVATTVRGPTLFVNAAASPSQAATVGNQLLALVDAGLSATVSFVAVNPDSGGGPAPTSAAMALHPIGGSSDPTVPSVWVVQSAGQQLSRYDSVSGALLASVPLAVHLSVAQATVTSRLLLARNVVAGVPAPVLLFAWTDSTGAGFVSALDASSDGGTTLELWRIATGDDATSAAQFRGQLALAANNQGATAVLYATAAGLTAYGADADADASSFQ